MAKQSPYVRIREKNKQIKDYQDALTDIASVLSCQPILIDILPAIAETQQWKKSYMAAMSDNDSLRVKMEDTIKDQVDKLTFNTQLENSKLKVEVERQRGILDTKDRELSETKNKIRKDSKGFWDFLYKIFKLN
jgi:hypothetical protein